MPDTKITTHKQAKIRPCERHNRNMNIICIKLVTQVKKTLKK